MTTEPMDPPTPVDYPGVYAQDDDDFEPVEPPAKEHSLLLDELGGRLTALRMLTESTDQGEFGAAIEEFGSQGQVEEEMLLELAGPAPLAHPERFDEAHRRMMRALEVFDRNGPRPPSALHVPKAVRPVAGKVVQLLTTAIVRNHQKRLVREMRQLYALREANAPMDSEDYQLLSSSRIQIDAILADLNKSSLPLPAFLGVGALISALLSTVRASLSEDWSRYLFSVVFLIVGLGAFWCILRAAGIARRRTRIALDDTTRALWEVIGDAGRPPRDHSKLFATIATVLLIAVWVIVPAVIAWAAVDWNGLGQTFVGER